MTACSLWEVTIACRDGSKRFYTKPRFLEPQLGAEINIEDQGGRALLARIDSFQYEPFSVWHISAQEI